MALSGRRWWHPLVTQAREPGAAQADTLRRILRANADTTFGRQHGFGRLTTPQAFRRAVPVCDYETLRPHVEMQRTTGTRALTREAPLFYAQTSGSTGAPKYIPVTPTALGAFKSEQSLFAYLQYRARPDAYAGWAWGIMGAADEGRLDSGHVVGSVSGHLYTALPRSVQARFVAPPAVAAITDYDTKYLVLLRLALGVRDITYIGAPNPSTFVRLLALLNERRDDLARSLSEGTVPNADRIPGEVMDAIAPRLMRDPTRATDLRGSRTLSYADLWPRIALVTTWTGGSCGIALDTLRPALPAACSVMELGYQATEFRGTVALRAEVADGFPMLHHHFLEFVPEAEWETDREACVGLEALQVGARYYVVVTTAAGLYRYAMNDIVEVTGFLERTPLLRFVQKGRGVTNVTGEKLYEAQVIAAVQGAARARGVATPFFLLVAHDTPAEYRVYVEVDAAVGWPVAAMGADIDARLADANPEYRAKRKSGRLNALSASRLRPGAGEAFKAACVRAGQREGQFKPVVLHYSRDLSWPVDQYVVS